MDPRRKQWNDGHQELHDALAHPHEHPNATEIFSSQHALLHSSMVSDAKEPTFDDEIWQDLPDDAARVIPTGMEHSIVWCIWHLARIEDVTMNVLLAGSAQVFNLEPWPARMQVRVCETGNAMDPQEIVELSARVDVAALRALALPWKGGAR